MKHIVIGTAGHVDHGKTELVKAMTGIDTDRLKEEKQRGISIELGFAHLKLPSGRTASIVDVPGHEKFIKNMLAGACGIDLVLLVIAADEGVMPQTAEHMDILQLLNVKTGIVALTKIDMVDSDWLEMVIDEVKSFLKDTTFKEAPIVPVSAVTKEGLDVLLKKIDEVVGKLEKKKAFDFLYLPVDRVFSVTGFGSVATGTLLSGEISLGNEIEILPDKILAKVRNIEVHNKKVTKAFQSQRVAVNLSGVEARDLKRGCVISNPDVIKPTDIIDVKLKLLKSAVKPLKNRTRIRLHIGTSEIMCRVILLDRDELAA
ncbi:selenocysteine-specific translation elongation factor, partial [Peptococcaceae bacterium]|nr:selenocysteine-specific translation elongation factor [Peptococcaceae bacterium]